MPRTRKAAGDASSSQETGNRRSTRGAVTKAAAAEPNIDVTEEPLRPRRSAAKKAAAQQRAETPSPSPSPNTPKSSG